jgi:hypothetical protein
MSPRRDGNATMSDRIAEPPPGAGNQDAGDCADLCHACHRACVDAMMYSLGRGGAFADPDHIRLLADCIQLTAATADFLLRESPIAGAVCGVCAEACDACATECETYNDERPLSLCARLCRRCAAACQGLSGV